MTTIKSIISSLLPRGSNRGGPRSIEKCPGWPPDLFAIAATLIDRSGFYSEPPYMAAWDPPTYKFDSRYLSDIERTGKAWSGSGTVPPALSRLWKKLLSFGKTEIGGPESEWQLLAIQLMAIADQASAGAGFSPNLPDAGAGSRSSFVAALVLRAHKEFFADKEARFFEYIPHSLCQMVSDDVACVQPKTNVPAVGCTLRSMSHHLALLPSKSVVATSWLYANSKNPREDAPFNILLIPYPFVIMGNDFKPTQDRIGHNDCFFEVRASDLGADATPLASRMVEFIKRLVEQARREVEQVHGVVLPELALSHVDAEEVARGLARADCGVELFISGVLSEKDPAKPRNCAYEAVLLERQVVNHSVQSKHHRWCLDESQIVRYNLGSVLDPHRRWWEKIDVSNRTCVFTVIRPGATLAVLVCEDMARSDPVMPIMNAVGPNLVIALLMDGPQLERRWPARYATVLADDPGSSVLTLTSLGMIRRSYMPGDPENREIALWKQPGGVARELKLPKGDHALVLSLTISREDQVTLDRRTGGRKTRRFQLSGAQGVRLNPAPAWPLID